MESSRLKDGQVCWRYLVGEVILNKIQSKTYEDDEKAYSSSLLKNPFA